MTLNTLTASQAAFIAKTSLSMDRYGLTFQAFSLLLNISSFYIVGSQFTPVLLTVAAYELNLTAIFASIVGAFFDFLKAKTPVFFRAELQKQNYFGAIAILLIGLVVMSISIASATYAAYSIVDKQVQVLNLANVDRQTIKNLEDDNASYKVNITGIDKNIQEQEQTKQEIKNKNSWQYRTAQQTIDNLRKDKKDYERKIEDNNAQVSTLKLSVANSPKENEGVLSGIHTSFGFIYWLIIGGLFLSSFLEFIIFTLKYNASFIDKTMTNHEQNDIVHEDSVTSREQFTDCHASSHAVSQPQAVNNDEQIFLAKIDSVNECEQIEDKRIAVNTLDDVLNLIAANKLPANAPQILKSDVYLVKRGLAYKAVNKIKAQEQAKQKDVTAKSTLKNDVPSSNIILLPSYKN